MNLNSLCQIRLLNDSLHKTTITSTFKNRYFTSYSDRADSTEILALPVGLNGKKVEIIDFKLDSKEVLDQIVGKIFTKDQLSKLDTIKSYISCVVESTGKIVSVSLVFSNCDPEIPKKQMVELARQVRENLKFDLIFDLKIKQHGYIMLSVPIKQREQK